MLNTNKMCLCGVIGIFCFTLAFGVRAPMVVNGQDSSTFPLFCDGSAAAIVIDPNDAEVVSVVAAAVCEDLRLVTGVGPKVMTQLPTHSKAIVLAGTLGKNRWLDQLVARKQIDISYLQKNPWESYLITVVNKPFDGIDQALVVAGSDRRGTAYGLFELSEMAGVSPWVWWADVVPDKQTDLYFKPGLYTFGPPSVKYRGIFLNDEDFGLKPWAAKTFEPEVGDIGPKTYAKICELLLRLKANFLWPAMHECTKAFNFYPDNKVVADRYAIVMGSTHCDPLLFCTASEWDTKTMGPWQYDINREGILKILDRRVKETAQYENVYTMGMRGIHDSGMIGRYPMPQKVSLMEQIFQDQREILHRYVSRPAEEIPQIFVPYKEVLPIYDAGLKVPDDITLVWVDDNFGFIRRFSDAAEQKRSGGAGAYYHISYWGGPHCYLWLDTTPQALIWKEMMRLYQTGGQRLWVVNVGDIKPGERGTEFFLQMGWDITRWNEDSVSNYPKTMAVRDFGQSYAADIADILNQSYILNYQRKPEFMGFNRSFSQRSVNDPQFSLWTDGDECQRRVEAFDLLLKRAQAIYDKLPQAKRDAYYQLVLYPVLGAAKMNEKILHAYRSREYAKQGRASANQFAKKAEQAYEAINKATTDYNMMAGGKWRYMMSSDPLGEAVFKMPPVGSVTPQADGLLGVAVEGLGKAINPVEDKSGRIKALSEKIVLESSNPGLVFYGRTAGRYFVDLFNYGLSSAEYKITVSEPWVHCSQGQGTLSDNDQRVWVNLDSAQLKKMGNSNAVIRIESVDLVYEIPVKLIAEAGDSAGSFARQGGGVGIDASDADKMTASHGRQWKPVQGLGRSGKAMGLFPLTGWNCDNLQQAAAECPVMTYRIVVSAGGSAALRLDAIPAFPLVKDQPLRCAVSLDEGPALWIDFKMGSAEGGNRTLERQWGEVVLSGTMSGQTQIEMPAGTHLLKVWGTNPDVMLDKINIFFTETAIGYLGPTPVKIQ